MIIFQDQCECKRVTKTSVEEQTSPEIQRATVLGNTKATLSYIVYRMAAEVQ